MAKKKDTAHKAPKEHKAVTHKKHTAHKASAEAAPTIIDTPLEAHPPQTFPQDPQATAPGETPEVPRVPVPEPKVETFPNEEPEYEDVPDVLSNFPSHASEDSCTWVDDWTLLKEVLKTNKELRGYGNSKKWVPVFYGPMK